MNYSWNWAVLISEPYLQWLGWGTLMTIVISLVSWAIALAIGTIVGTFHSTGNSRIRLFTSSYISLFRNIPLLLQMFLWFFVVPELLPDAIGTWLKRDLPHSEVVTAIVALGLFTASRVAVQVSAGIVALPRGQGMAAKAAGFSTAQAYRLVLLPQAFRLIVPPLTSEFLTIFKNSSIAMTIGVFELTAQTQQIESFTYQGFEAFTAATVIYMSIALLVTTFMRQVERRTSIGST
ncbi:ABC transporter permease subunit [Sinorhizobium meliloti]|jgi:glutamate/aspartate transport system permease protein|uniref:amino acid ABC transporter permease n=1 Tax=Rhizobium meliloti TaxID=382 RepID=UPI00299F1A77|nr:amino acid ABC transporter permease [Sinorhizobium meliloti]MDW9389068.1 ABC transporter permease subunit [Sinorhizobium meliloti]MDW9394859.1 ABC transporter permease subunit [Sinorhizobium meliloti]MDW9546541.1 ABC transporter permease subunit [Sinorhizobium meliloti]